MQLLKVMILTVGSVLLLSLSAKAQSTEGPRTTSPTYSGSPSARSPYAAEAAEHERDRRKKRKKKRKRKGKQSVLTQSLEEAREEFWDRQEKLARQRSKIAKKMRKPQYSDPTYFGHKRKPKIRPLHKRKLCKECGIVH